MTLYYLQLIFTALLYTFSALCCNKNRQFTLKLIWQRRKNIGRTLPCTTSNEKLTWSSYLVLQLPCRRNRKHGYFRHILQSKKAWRALKKKSKRLPVRAGAPEFLINIKSNVCRSVDKQFHGRHLPAKLCTVGFVLKNVTILAHVIEL